MRVRMCMARARMARARASTADGRCACCVRACSQDENGKTMANPAFRNLAKQLGMTHEWLLVTGATAEDDMTPDLDHVMKISRVACGNALSATSLGGGDRRGNLHRAMRREREIERESARYGGLRAESLEGGPQARANGGKVLDWTPMQLAAPIS